MEIVGSAAADQEPCILPSAMYAPASYCPTEGERPAAQKTRVDRGSADVTPDPEDAERMASHFGPTGPVAGIYAWLELVTAPALFRVPAHELM